ncbi:MAG: ABC transporter substrate-binding protein [Brevinema sp.]
MKYFLSMLFVLSVVACGNADSGPETKLTIWSQSLPDIDEGKIQQRLVDSFNEAHKGLYKAEIQFTPRGNAGSGFDDKVNAAITGDELPDVLNIDGPNVASFVASELVIPLDEYYTAEDLGTFIPSIIDQGTINNKLYALGFLESGVVLYYNKDIFAQAGITASKGLQDAWTWDDLYNAAVKIKQSNPNVLPLDMHLNEWTEWLTYGLLPFVQSADPQNKGIVSPDGLQVRGYLNSPAVKEALRFIQRLVREDLTTLTPATGAFRNGNAGMLLFGVWELENFRKNFTNLSWDYMAYPRHPKGRIHGPTGSWVWAVTKNSKNPEAAAKLILWMTSASASTEFAAAMGMPPVHTTSFEALPQFAPGGSNEIVMSQLVEYGSPRPKTPVYPILSYQFQSAIQAVALGEDVDKVVEDMTAKVERELTRYRK